MSRLSPAERAAADAIHWTPLSPEFARRDPAYTPPDPSEWEERAARNAVGAAAPILLAHHEADAAERIAQAIDQAWAQVKDATGTDDFTAYREGYLDGLEHAEAVARSTPLTVGVAPLDVEAPQYDRIERDASRTAHAALVADLRALHRTDLTDTGERPGRWVVIDADDLDALLDRHAPTTGETP